jgi:glycerol uptake facilitator-like aquaporin
MRRAVLAEALGSLLLATAVIGSGVMAERLADGNLAMALLANTLATVAALATLIALLAPASGAHFNPAVSLAQALRGELSLPEAGFYAVAQVIGCCLGAVLAHAMFDLPLIQTSQQERTGAGQWLAEAVATGGLILIVIAAPDAKAAAWRVPAWIGAAYWFTSSTSFANPAITLGRALTDTFSGIDMGNVPGFVVAQAIGAAAGLGLARLLQVDRRNAPA